MDILEEDSQFAAGLDVGVGISPPPTPPSLPQLANPLTLPGMEGALDPLSEAQLKSAEARAIFEATEESGPWMDDYWTLLDEGWTWRQAVYMLWEAQPPRKRIPHTQHELATRVLGLTSDRVISMWKQENPALVTRLRTLTVSVLEKARSRMLAALVESASKVDGRHSHADRKLALEMTGDYVRRQKVGVGLIEDLEGASTEDLASMAQLPDWEVVDEQGGKGAEGQGDV